MKLDQLSNKNFSVCLNGRNMLHMHSQMSACADECISFTTIVFNCYCKYIIQSMAFNVDA